MAQNQELQKATEVWMESPQSLKWAKSGHSRWEKRGPICAAYCKKRQGAGAQGTVESLSEEMVADRDNKS